VIAAVIAAIFALVGGILLFVMNQLAQKLVLDPLQEQTRVIAETAVALVRWAAVYANPSETPSKPADDACDDFRLLAAKLLAATHCVWGYKYAPQWLRVPTVEDIKSAAHDLVFLSNNIREAPGNHDWKHGTQNHEAAVRIRAALLIAVAI
jgi:hypothetical protein